MYKVVYLRVLKKEINIFLLNLIIKKLIINIVKKTIIFKIL